MLRQADREPVIGERGVSFDPMMALAAAGIDPGWAGASQVAASREPGVMARPLAGISPRLMPCLLHPAGKPSEILARFIKPVHAIESPDLQSRATGSVE